MLKRFLFATVISLFSCVMLPTTSKRNKIVVVNKTNNAVAVNTITVLPSQTKATIVTTLTSLPPKSVLPAIQKAIILKDIAKINQLLQLGFVPDDNIIVFAMDNKLPGRTILSFVQKAGHSLDYVFSNGLTLKISFHDCNDNFSFANTASFDETFKLVYAFLKMGYSPNFVLEHYWFQNVTNNDNAKLLGLLFQFGLDPNYVLLPCVDVGCCPAGLDEGISLFCWFITTNQVGAIEKCIACGADVNYKTSAKYLKGQNIVRTIPTDKVTPLSFALLLRKWPYRQFSPELDKIIEILVKHGASI